MPMRPVSHQLEDASRRRFEELLPSPWVARNKSHDYGTDLEVEVFDEAGHTTGIVFLVQLKATDDLREADRLRLDVDHLNYFSSLELATLIVRYCRPDGSFRFRWHFNIDRPLEGEAQLQKSITIRFGPDDQWTDTSAAQIEKTVSVLRLIRTFPPSQPVALVALESTLPPFDRYQLDEAMHEASEIAPVLAAPPGQVGQVSIQIVAEPHTLRVCIDCVSQFSFVLETFDKDAVVTAILYGSAALLGRHRLHQHAALVSQAILQLGRPCADKEIALAACRALTANPLASVGLAILNDLHRQDDVFGVLFLSDLRLNPLQAPERDQAMLVFLEAVRADAVDANDPRGEAAAHYSLGNVHRAAGRHVQAVHHYNRARKIQGEYLKSPYFLLEVGSCFFLTGHYGSAAEWYLEAHAAGQPDMSFVLGDALLFAGRAADARPHFQAAVDGSGLSGDYEAAVKLMLCTRLIERYGPILPVARSAARQVVREAEVGRQPRRWSDVVNIDALGDLANFNAGVAAAGERRHADAWMHFLIAAFRLPNDVEAWGNAILCALNGMDSDCLTSTMSCAMRLGGRDTYGRFRHLLVGQGAAGSLIADLDRLSRALWEEIISRREQGLTVRLLGDEKTEVVHLRPPGSR